MTIFFSNKQMKTVEKIVPLRIDVDNVGKLLNMSKKKYSWSFEFENKSHLIVLTVSLLSNKYNLKFDNVIDDTGVKPLFDALYLEYRAEPFLFKIIETNLTFNLYINGQLFQVGKPIEPKRQSTRIYLKDIPDQPSQEVSTPIRRTSHSIFDNINKSGQNSNSKSMEEHIASSNEKYLQHVLNETSHSVDQINKSKMLFQSSKFYEQEIEVYLRTDFDNTIENRIQLFKQLYGK